jgi:hypothetical protein
MIRTITRHDSADVSTGSTDRAAPLQRPGLPAGLAAVQVNSPHFHHPPGGEPPGRAHDHRAVCDPAARSSVDAMGLLIAGITLLLLLLTISGFAVSAVHAAEVAHSTRKDPA